MFLLNKKLYFLENRRINFSHKCMYCTCTCISGYLINKRFSIRGILSCICSWQGTSVKLPGITGLGCQAKQRVNGKVPVFVRGSVTRLVAGSRRRNAISRSFDDARQGALRRSFSLHDPFTTNEANKRRTRNVVWQAYKRSRKGDQASGGITWSCCSKNATLLTKKTPTKLKFSAPIQENQFLSVRTPLSCYLYMYMYKF